MKALRVFLADNQRTVRTGLRILLEHQKMFNIVGEAEEIRELTAKIKKSKAQIILLDWELSKESIAGIIPVLRASCPGLLIIAMSVRPESCISAVSAGVDAFVSKGDQPEKLLDTINNLIGKGGE